MTLPVYTSPHFGHAQNVTRVMAEVLLALVPAIIAIWWYFGWGVIINIIIATTAALATEAAVLRELRHPQIVALIARRRASGVAASTPSGVPDQPV